MSTTFSFLQDSFLEEEFPSLQAVMALQRIQDPFLAEQQLKDLGISSNNTRKPESAVEQQDMIEDLENAIPEEEKKKMENFWSMRQDVMRIIEEEKMKEARKQSRTETTKLLKDLREDGKNFVKHVIKSSSSRWQGRLKSSHSMLSLATRLNNEQEDRDFSTTPGPLRIGSGLHFPELCSADSYYSWHISNMSHSIPDLAPYGDIVEAYEADWNFHQTECTCEEEIGFNNYWEHGGVTHPIAGCEMREHPILLQYTQWLVGLEETAENFSPTESFWTYTELSAMDIWKSLVMASRMDDNDMPNAFYYIHTSPQAVLVEDVLTTLSQSQRHAAFLKNWRVLEDILERVAASGRWQTLHPDYLQNNPNPEDKYDPRVIAIDIQTQEIYSPHGLGEMVGASWKWMKSFWNDSTLTKDNYLKRIPEIVSKVFSSLTGTLMGSLKNIMPIISKLKETIIDYLGSLIPWDTITTALEESLIAKIVMALGCVGFFAAGVLTWKAISKMFSFSGAKIDQEHYEGTAPKEASVLAGTAILSSIFSLSGRGTEVIKQNLNFLTKLVAGGSALGSLGMGLWTILPVALKDAISYKFGTTSARSAVAARRWIDKATAALTLKSTPSVLASPEYHIMIDELVKEGTPLAKDTPDVTVKRQILTQLTQIIGIANILNQYRNTNKSRDIPYCFHISGKPGVGKTTIVNRILRETCGIPDDSHWNRGAHDEYWSGYMAQNAVIYDEFLVGGDTRARDQIAKEFISLVSPSIYIPNMASTDNMTVGIKGTVAAPKAVVTINNTDYDIVEGIPNEAFQRRRRFVVRIKAKKTAKFVEGSKGNIDLSAYTPEERKSFAWANFYVMPGESSRGNYEPKTYEEFSQFLTEDYAQYRQTCEAIAEVKGVTRDQIDPQELIDEALRTVTSMPSTPPSVFSAIKEIFYPHSPTLLDVAKNGIRDYEVINTVNADCFGKIMENFPYPGEDEGPEAVREWETCITGLAEDKSITFRNTFKVPETCTHETYTVDEVDRIYPGPVDKHINCFHCSRRGKSKDATTMCDYFSRELVYENPHQESRIKFWCRHYFEKLRRAGKEFDFGTMSFKIPAAIVTILGATALAIWYFSGRSEELTYRSTSYTPRDKSRQQRSRSDRSSNWRRGAISAHAVNPEVKMYVKGTEIRGLAVYDNVVLSYAHAFYDRQGEFKEDPKATLEYNGGRYQFELKSDLVSVNMKSDQILVTIQNTKLQKFKDIRKRFLKQEQVPFVDHVTVSLGLEEGLQYGQAHKVTNKGYNYHDMYFHFEECLRYEIRTKEGDCGSPVVIATGPLATKYVGLHTAGTAAPQKPFSICSIMTYEDFFSKDFESDSEDGETTDEYKPHSNIISMAPAPSHERLTTRTESKLKRSRLSRYLSQKSTKRPATLNPTSTFSPWDHFILDLNHADPPVADWDVLDEVYEEVLHFYQRKLFWSAGKGKLSFEQAIKGIPGKLASLKCDTGPGYPYAFRPRVKSGKKDLFYFDQFGELQYCDRFKADVEAIVEDMEKGGDPMHVWLCYLKDELVSEQKARECRTRVIFCGNAAATVAFRMYYGTLLSAFNEANQDTASAVGLNPYSYDMNTMFHYLNFKKDLKFIAGDYKQFDKRYHPQFRDRVYDILEQLCLEVSPNRNPFRYIREYDTQSPFHVNNNRIRVKACHISGSFFTTIINCLMNEMYLRYVFKITHPGRQFLDHCRLKVLGDDHIISTDLDSFDPLTIQRELAKIGQIYTDDTKSITTIKPATTDFSDITFLGAHPVLVKGRWSGALKKEVIWNCLHWTKTHNLTIVSEARQMVEFASQWDSSFYHQFYQNVLFALDKMGVDTGNFIYDYISTRDIVAKRTTDSGLNFYATVGEDYYCHSASNSATANRQTPEFKPVGLTRFHTQQTRKIEAPEMRPGVKGEAIQAESYPLDFGTSGLVKRDSFIWNSVQTVDSVIWSARTPYQLLQKGDQNNLQNMPFQRHMMWNGKTKVVAQVNGTPFQQGFLVLFYQPLGDFAPDCFNRFNVFAYEHDIIDLSSSSTAELTVPFTYPAQFFNTTREEDFCGTFKVLVVSTLRTPDQTNSSVNVTIYSAFPDSEFVLPRPVPIAASMKRLCIKEQSEDEEEECFEAREMCKDTEKVLVEVYKPHGNTSSTQIHNEYTIKDVVGNVPVENSNDPISNPMSFDTEVQAIPMDNPPLAGGALPTAQQFPSMSKTVGVEPTVGMQMNSEAMYREGDKFFHPDNCSIERLCGMKCLIGSFMWSKSDPVGTRKEVRHMNSTLGIIDHRTDFSGREISPNVFFLNQFVFWKANLEYEYRAVMTPYHSGRLSFSTAYGAQDVTDEQQTVYPNNVMDFKGEQRVQTVTVPYNAYTRYLRTVEPDKDSSEYLNFSMGVTGVFVANELKAPDTVTDTIEVLVFGRFDNVRPWEPRPTPLCFPRSRSATSSIDNPNDPAITVQPALTDDEHKKTRKTKKVVRYQNREHYQAHASNLTIENDAIVDEGGDAEEMNNKPVAVTEGEQRTVVRPCKLNIGDKSEYIVGNIIDVMRRHSAFKQGSAEQTVQATSSNAEFSAINVRPHSPMARMFAAWSGTMKYRIFVQNALKDTVIFTPTYEGGQVFQSLDSALAAPTSVTSNDQSQAYVGTFLLSNVDSTHTAREIAYGCSTRDLQWIDVSVPFTNHYDFCVGDITNSRALWEGPILTAGPSPGALTTPIVPDRVHYQAVGDDFRLGFYRPARCHFKYSDTTTIDVACAGARFIK